MLLKIELKGTKLKNSVKEILLGTGQEDLFSKIEEYCKPSLRKIISLIKDITFITDVEKESVYKALLKFVPEGDLLGEDYFTTKTETDIASLIRISQEKNQHIASNHAIDKMQKELEHLIQIEIPQNSKEIGIAQEKGDLRENAEYKAAMEQQAILQSRVTKVENDLKNLIPIAGSNIPNNKITIGTKTRLLETQTDDIFVYVIMDQWDADIDKGIISYLSPLGKTLLDHQKGDVIEFITGDKKSIFKVEDISLAVKSDGYLL